MASTILTFNFDKPDLAVLRKRVLQNLCSNDHGDKDYAHMSLFPRSIGLSPLPQTALSGWKEGQDIGLLWFFMKRKGRGSIENRYKYLRPFFFPGVAERIWGVPAGLWGLNFLLAWQRSSRESWQECFSDCGFYHSNFCFWQTWSCCAVKKGFAESVYIVLYIYIYIYIYLSIFYTYTCVCMYVVCVCANVYSMYICVYAHVYVPLQKKTGVTFVRVFFKTIPFRFFHRCGFLLPGNPTGVEPLSRTSVETMCRQAESLEGRRMWTKIYTRFLIHLTKLTTWKQLMGDMGHDVWLYCF